MNTKIIHPSISELTKSVCNELLNAKKECQTGLCAVALSGGSTPKAILRMLAMDYPVKIDWAQYALYWVDERCVPHTSPESNYGEAKRVLLNSIDALTFPINGEANPVKEAERYGQLMLSQLPVRSGFPSFDLIFLGIGTDGHTASIFPNAMHLLSCEAPCAAAVQPQSGQHRVTMTGRTLNASKRIVFLATGTEKQSVLLEVLGEHENAKNYPAWHVASQHNNCIWLCDEAAGG